MIQMIVMGGIILVVIGYIVWLFFLQPAQAATMNVFLPLVIR
jgi:hypothetical protein